MGSVRVAAVLALAVVGGTGLSALGAEPLLPGRTAEKPEVPSSDEPTALAREALPRGTSTATAGPAPARTATSTADASQTHAVTPTIVHTDDTRTATSAPSTPELGEAPLSDEDLALLAALDARTATTSTRAVAMASPTWWLMPAPLARPTLIVPRARLVETVGRTLAESLDGYPTITDTARRWIAGDALVLRGQTGHHVALTIEGVPLGNALSRSRDVAGLMTLDPWMIDEVVLERPGVASSSPHPSAASLALEGLEPPTSPGFEAGAEIDLRTADRSTATHATAGAANELAGFRVAAGYGDFRPTRIATSNVGTDLGGGWQRFNAMARARVLGRPKDDVRIQLGADVDRLLNVVRTDLLDPLVVDRRNERLLGFARVDVGGDTLGASLLVARQTFSRTCSTVGEVEPDPPGIGSCLEELLHRAAATALRTTSEERATSHFVRLTGRAELASHLVASAGGMFEASAAEDTSAADVVDLGDVRNLAGFVGLDLDLDWLSAYALASLVDAKTTARALAVDDTSLVTQGGARLRVVGPLGLRLGWSQSRYVPTVRDLANAGRALRPEHGLTLELGPTFHRQGGFVEATLFYMRLDDAIEPVSLALERLVNIEELSLFGLELSGGIVLADRLRVGAALTWSEGRDLATNAPVLTLPSVTGRASIRYDLPIRSAFLEAHVRGTTEPIYVAAVRAADPPASLAALAPSSFARIGVTGATDLALGFRLLLTIENVLDTPHRAPTSLVPGTGLDVRAALSWAWR